MLDLMLTIAVGLVSGYIVYRLKVPGGMMVGAIIGVSAMNIAFGTAWLPDGAKVAAQISAGAFIGCTVERSDLVRMRMLARPAFVLLSGMLIQNLLIGYLIYFTSPLDLVTSLMSGVPGGLTDIPIIAADMGADVPKVAVLQIVRMITGVGLFPTLIALVDRREQRRRSIDAQYSPPEMPIRSSVEKNNRVFMTTILVATAFGLIGMVAGFPAGTLLFSMLAVIVMKMTIGNAYMPLWVKRLTQVLSGAYIGSSMDYAGLIELRHVLLPAIFLIVIQFATCYIVGHVLHRHFGINLIIAMLAATPAGASDMMLISSDLGVQSADLIILQIIRLVVVISVFPQIIRLIILLAG